MEILERVKESLRPAARGKAAERSARMTDTLRLGIEALENGPIDKEAERAIRSLKRAIQEHEKWKAECEQKLS